MASLDDIKRLQDQFTTLFKDATDARSRVSQLENSLWETRGRQEGTERKLADTEKKLADMAKKLKDTQKKQAVSERKSEGYEKELTETRARLLENESKFEDWKAKQEKNSKKIEDKVQLNSKEIGKLTMLKSIFKSSLIGKAVRSINQDEMENMEARLDQVDENLTVVHKNGYERSKKIQTIEGETSTIKADVTGLQKTVDHHSTKLKYVRMHYQSKICRNTEVDHDRGVLKFRNDSNDSKCWSAFMARQPLTPACPSFSVELVSKDTASYWGWAIGLGRKDWDGERGMGDARGGVEYGGDGRIYDSGKKVHNSSDDGFTVGDIIKVMLTFSPTAVTFSKNGKTVFCHPLDPGVFSINNLHPAIVLDGEGTAVRLLEADPWRA